MNHLPIKKFAIRLAEPDEYEELGRMTVQIYEQLPGMPGVDEQPEYYAMLYDVKKRANKPTTEILVAATPDNEILGGVTFIGDMKYYESGGSASTIANSSGIRLLAVKPEARAMGVGKALTNACIQKAAKRGSRQVILHTTRSMKVAWGMYQRMGFLRSPDLDFKQSKLSVFGFRLFVDSRDITNSWPSFK